MGFIELDVIRFSQNIFTAKNGKNSDVTHEFFIESYNQNFKLGFFELHYVRFSQNIFTAKNGTNSDVTREFVIELYIKKFRNYTMLGLIRISSE